MPVKLSIINTTAIKDAVKSKATLKAFLSNKTNTAVLLSSSNARNAFIKELKASGMKQADINSLLGQVAGSVVAVKWD